MSFGYRLGIIEKELKPKVERGNCSVMVLCVCVCVCMWVYLGLEPEEEKSGTFTTAGNYISIDL